jgi:ribosomal protein S18 acetylase RimI-like enzyme
MTRFLVPDRTIVQLIPGDLKTLMEMQYAIYPLPFVEEEAYIKWLLENEPMNRGVVMGEQLAGFLLVTREFAKTQRDIFLYDLGIMPEHQKKGLGTHLLSHFLKESREKDLRVGLSCRDTSIGMFSDPDKLAKMGYKMAAYEYEPDGYYPIVGIHEDIYNLEIEPI